MPQVERHASGARSQHERKLGANVARLLRGAWRESVNSSEPVANLTEAELTEITPLLCRSGAGALAWWRLRDTPLANSAAGRELHEVYRRFRLSALIHEREIAHVFSLLRAEGIEAVLVKGWAIARRYPDAALRPYGDIDLCVSPAQFAKASDILKRVESIAGPFVDLHCGFGEVGRSRRQGQEAGAGGGGRSDPDWDQLFERSRVVFLSEPGAVATGFQRPMSKVISEPGAAGERRSPRGVVEATGSQERSKVQRPMSNVISEPGAVPTGSSIPVRILSDEDHLRILCLHLLRSGARRPAWLCDVALLVEQVQSPGGSPTVRKGSDVVQSPTSKVQSPADRVAVTDSSRGLSVRRDTPGSDRINVPDPEGVKQGFDPTSNVQNLVRTGSGPGSPGGQPAWGGGSDRVQDSTGSCGDFNWDVCLGRNPVPANWVASAVKLAHQLLGANIENTPFARQVQSPMSKVQSQVQLPRWLAPAVLQQWGGRADGSRQTAVGRSERVRGSSPTMREGVATSLVDLYNRWDNPIRATAAVGGRFQTGSLATFLTANGFKASGRTYADLAIGQVDPGGVVVDASDSGTGTFQFDNLAINSTGTATSKLTFDGSLGTNGIIIQGDIISNGVGAPGTLPDVMLTPGTIGITLNKPSGTMTFGNDGSNSRSIDFEGNVDFSIAATTLALSRIVQLGFSNPNSKTLTVTPAANITGGSSGYVIGTIRHLAVPEGFTFPVGTPNGYSPVQLHDHGTRRLQRQRYADNNPRLGHTRHRPEAILDA